MTIEEIREIIKEEVQIALKDFQRELFSNDKYTFQKAIQIFDGRNIIFGQGTGTKIGTSTSQKLSFYGVEPVSQQSHIADPSGGLTIDAEARTAIIAILVVLENLGFKNTS